MSKILFIFLLCKSFFCYAQNASKKYYELVKKADSLYNARDYKKSAFTYSAAFKEAGWKGYSKDRYNAACSWAMANYPDSAFCNLFKIANFLNYIDYGHIANDSDLNLLHEDKRWKSLLKKVKENKDKSEENLNKPLVRILDTIYLDDQSYRLQIDSVGKKNGWSSPQVDSIWKIISSKDVINLGKVKSILDNYGWLGSEEIGKKGSTTLFLVIQHSDKETQEKYLPMMRMAVKNNKAEASALALLEDRVALGNGRKQIYGSQIGGQGPNGYYVLPLRNPDSLDIWRARVGLKPMAEYVKQWNIKWDIKEYKELQLQPENTEKCGIHSINIDSRGLVTWVAENDTLHLPFIIEQFRWKKWIKIEEVDNLGKDEFNIYSCNVALFHGENFIRIKHGSPICISDSVKLTTDIPEIKCFINKKQKIIEFSFDTFYEITDIKGVLFKKGYSKKISISDLAKNKYILFYDNSIVKFKM